MKSPIDRLLDQVEFRCTICNALAGTCSCWIKCECGWHYRNGESCRNPIHKKKE